MDTQSETGKPHVTIRTRSGKCRWYKINTPIYVVVYHCLKEGRLSKPQGLFSATNMSGALVTPQHGTQTCPGCPKRQTQITLEINLEMTAPRATPMRPMRAFIGLCLRNLKSVTAPFQKAVRTFRYGTFDGRLSMRAGYRVRHRLRA